MSDVQQKECKLYIVLSRTDTFLAKIIRYITKAKYNHVSLSLDPSLDQMYSFGRRYPRNPLWGGFVKESKNEGFFKRCQETEVTILSLKIDEDTYHDMQIRFQYMSEHKFLYHYNYLGLFFAIFNIHFKPTDRTYFCSEFAKEVLVRHNIEGATELKEVPQPIHFMNIPNTTKIYTGKLTQYDAA